MNDMTRKNTVRMGSALLCAMALSAPALASGPAAKFNMMDTNKDGKVSAAEHVAAATKMFGEMDANGDGNVTAQEMDARHDMKMGAKAEAKTMNDADAAMGHGAMHHEMSSAEKIAKMDTNGDGMLSAAEHDAGAKKMFSEMDKDKNGSLSRQEMAASHAAMMSDK